MTRVHLTTGRDYVRVDGNAIAGPLSELLDNDMTMAMLTCGPCGNSSMLATTIVELDNSGFIVLCPSCRHTLFTVVKSGGRMSLNLQGLRELAVST
jgi:hypothetical protein